MRNRVFGIIGIVWGSLTLISWFARGMPLGGGSYGIGQNIGIVIGTLMFVAGWYYLIKSIREA